MQLTWEFTSREKCVIGEVIYHCPGLQWSMRVGSSGESQILLAAPSPAGSALSRNMAGVYGVSPTFPSMLSDEILPESHFGKNVFFFLAIIWKNRERYQEPALSSTISFPGRQWVWNHCDDEQKLICLRRPAQLCPECIVRLFLIFKEAAELRFV